MFPLILKSKKAIRAVREQKYKLVCLNDNIHIRNYDKMLKELKASFESILPEKSSFEL
jgi:ribosomal protein L30E